MSCVSEASTASASISLESRGGGGAEEAVEAGVVSADEEAGKDEDAGDEDDIRAVFVAEPIPKRALETLIAASVVLGGLHRRSDLGRGVECRETAAKDLVANDVFVDAAAEIVAVRNFPAGARLQALVCPTVPIIEQPGLCARSKECTRSEGQKRQGFDKKGSRAPRRKNRKKIKPKNRAKMKITRRSNRLDKNMKPHFASLQATRRSVLLGGAASVIWVRR